MKKEGKGKCGNYENGAIKRTKRRKGNISRGKGEKQKREIETGNMNIFIRKGKGYTNGKRGKKEV